jgi:hypothetical protein
MIRWAPFHYGEATYDLGHLHPSERIFRQAATKDKPARDYVVQVIYGLHCFTRKPKDGEPAPDLALWYADTREKRVFDFGRYELSKQLPGVVEQLLGRKCYHSGKGNFFVVELFTVGGQKAEYEIYFDASRASTKKGVNLYVQSAYIRDQQHAGNRPKKKPIRFEIILFNVQNGRPNRIPE